MTNLREQYWAVEVPEGTKNFRIGKSARLKRRIFYDTDLNFFAIGQRIVLPPGTWSIVCTSKEVTCDHAHEIVERDGEGFKDYSQGFHHDIPFPDPVQSFETLLTSKGCDRDKNYLIIKKMSDGRKESRF